MSMRGQIITDCVNNIKEFGYPVEFSHTWSFSHLKDLKKYRNKLRETYITQELE